MPNARLDTWDLPSTDDIAEAWGEAAAETKTIPAPIWIAIAGFFIAAIGVFGLAVTRAE